MMTKDRSVACFRIPAVLTISEKSKVSGLLHHLQHECAAIPIQVVPRADPTEHPIHYPNGSLIGRHETTALC